jgi:hypothetical protein
LTQISEETEAFSWIVPAISLEGLSGNGRAENTTP